MKKLNTIAEGEEYIIANFEKGVRCPCCGQWTKQYKRKLNSGMCLFLIELYKTTIKTTPHKGTEYLYFSSSTILKNLKVGTKSLDFSVMKHFGLIETPEHDPFYTGKRSSGLWRITQNGIKFVQGMVQMPMYVKLYNNKVYGYSLEKVSIQDALGTKFNYNDLMGIQVRKLIETPVWQEEMVGLPIFL